MASAAAACGLVVALMVVALVTVKPEAVVAPNLTDEAPLKPVPVMVTVVPPVVGPLVGVNEVTAGAATKAKSWLDAPEPPTVVTEMAAVAAACGLVVALMVVALVTVKPGAVVAPKLTDEAPMKPVPVMVTVVPPVVGPRVGVNEVTTGTGATNL